MIMQKQKKSKKLLLRIVSLMIIDMIAINLSYFLSLLLLNDFDISKVLARDYMPHLVPYCAISTACTILLFIPFKLYNSLWKFAGQDELVHITVACGIAMLARIGVNMIPGLNIFPTAAFPIISGLFVLFLIGSSRMAYRLLRSLTNPVRRRKKARTLLIGAGDAGAMALREFQTSIHSINDVICVVDDDYTKRGSYLRGVKVVGNRNDIPAIVKEFRIEQIVYAIPTASANDRREILNICQKTRCQLKTLPGLYQLANGTIEIQKIRNVDVLDLLGRDSVKVDLHEIAGYLTGKTVLVTGGGGSIGSELCRQIAKNHPKKLVLLDIYENNAYDIQQELLRSIPDIDLDVQIGSVRDTKRINMIFERYHPEIVFHAAAHKHVPLMEDSPNEAIKNNVFGTLHTALAADRYGAERFVMISTDKAVNPTNIMGASKRLCEMIIQSMSNRSRTKFVAVRFGNVLGSNGSVIPLFKKQIEEGGPVTVTHKDIIRYFMTIPEAVSLVLQAGAFAKQGEIFILDMGEPVRIDDLARNMIRLSGFEPDVDIEIRYTGLRPGEKLYEEMLMREEGLRKTDNELIFIGQPLDMDESIFYEQLERLEVACNENSPDIKRLVSEMVPTYRLPVGAGK